MDNLSKPERISWNIEQKKYFHVPNKQKLSLSEFECLFRHHLQSAHTQILAVISQSHRGNLPYFTFTKHIFEQSLCC